MEGGCLPSCQKQCTMRISSDQRSRIHEDFWNQNSSLELKRQFIVGRVVEKPVSRKRERDGSRSGRRTKTLQYSFVVDSKNIMIVCKKYFLSTLCVSAVFVKHALMKKLPGGFVSRDNRGRHDSPNKLPEEVRTSVRVHIESFPAAESHYSRNRTARKYLGSHLNLSTMYRLYVEKCEQEAVPEKLIAKQWLYNEIFNFEYNISFKEPSNDTCDLCDRLLKDRQDVQDEHERQRIQHSYEQHLDEAGYRYKKKAEDKQESRQNALKSRTIMVDLQRCLPTPLLTNSQAFYLRKLWTLNLTIHDSTAGKTTCLMWDESVGARGGCEIGSAILKWALNELSCSTVEELTVWSDNCPGQNRNLLVVGAYFWILRSLPNLKTINHKYLLRGHSHLEADADHSIIERAKKRLEPLQIMIPWDWQQFTRGCRPNNPFNVVNMELNDFKNFHHLFNSRDSPLIRKSKDAAFRISEFVHVKMTKVENGDIILHYKTDFRSENFNMLDLHRKSRNAQWPAALTPIRTTPRPITKAKKSDLKTALQWIPTIFHPFYENLTTSDGTEEYPDTDETDGE